ncbi:MAG: DUF1800 domain-containing protein [Bacteroidota bacterium]
MDRRATLKTLFGGYASSRQNRLTLAAPPVITSGLDPYTGPWELQQAGHLLRRTTLGPTLEQIKQTQIAGLQTTVAQLLEVLPPLNPPVNHFFENDPNVPIGATWIEAPYSTTTNFIPYRLTSLGGWMFGAMLQEGISLREKMALFWHNHFVTAEINDARFRYRYYETLREYAVGNFRDLTKAMTIDPSMLRYLNGNQNTKNAPNENYARELLELFTVGKGELAEPGDYTTFTEQDVVEIAKVLTGWRDTGYVSPSDSIPVGNIFLPNQHDTTTKQLSHRFGEVTISNAGDQEYSQLIDIIFESDAVATFLCRKLYRWFVFYDIPEEVEQNVIAPMAQCLRENDYEVAPVLEALLQSEHFYDSLNYGVMIKNPLDFVISTVKSNQVAYPDQNLAIQYTAWFESIVVLNEMQMGFFAHPSVAGWKAYYQEPLFYRHWINAVTLPVRMDITTALATTGVSVFNQTLIIDVLGQVAALENPADPNALIEELCVLMFPLPVTQNQRDYFKSILINGLPDFEWTIEYSDYLADPQNSMLAASVENKLRNLYRAMLNMSEFYLS